MDPFALPPIIFLATVIVTILLVGLLVALGLLLARDRRRFVGTASLRNTCLEVAVLNLLILVPNVILITRLAFDLVPPLLILPANIASVILFAANLILPPLWAAIRLTIPTDQTPDGYKTAYRKAGLWLVLTFFATTVFCYLIFSLLVMRLLLPRSELQFNLTLLPFSGTYTLAFLILFLFMRGMMDLVRFTIHRHHLPKPRQDFTPHYRRRYSFLLSLLVIALCLWAVAYVLYYNRQSYPDLTCVPPIYRQTLFPMRFQTPLDRPPGLMAALAFPPLLILLAGIFVARRRIPEKAALLYGWLCLIYGILALDIYPRWGCEGFWTARLLAWLFISPVQLHFALVFPNEEESIQEEQRPLWHWVKEALYGGFILIIPLWLYFSMRTFQDSIALVQQQGALLPLFALYGFIVIFSYLFSLIAGVYILWHTSRGLGAAYRNLKARPSDGCRWLDVVSGREDELAKTALGQQQLRLLVLGAMIAVTGLILWFLLLFPVFVKNIDRLGGWPDVFYQACILVVFLAVLVAIRQYKLWYIGRVLVDAYIWSLLIVLSLGFFQWIESQVEEFLSRWVGLLAFLGMAYISLDRILSPLLYRWLRGDLLNLQQKLKETTKHLRELAIGTPGEENALKILAEVVPERATAAWLLTPSSEQPVIFSINNINHSPSCQGRCQAVFIKEFSTVQDSERIVLPPDLIKALIEAVQEEKIIPLVVERLNKENLVWRLLMGHWKPSPVVEDTTLARLRAAKVALVVPLGGGNNLLGMFVIASDNEGDNYDARDLEAFSEFANAMSIWISARGVD